MSMTNTLRQILLLVGKDLRIEARSRQTLGLVVMLGLLIVVVLGLGLGPAAGPGLLRHGRPMGGISLLRRSLF